MAVMVDKRMKDAAKVQEALTKNGCIIRVRLGLHEIHNFCADEGSIPRYLGGAKKEVAVLKNGLRKIKGGRVKTLEL
jgi:hypothetical protein